ncbi:MAG: hypothetical protein JXR07_14935 [Reichenbachiella sp.]
MSRELSPHKSLITGITIVIGIITIIGFVLLLAEGENVFTVIAFLIVMLWINIFIGYFIWATYFYNLNFGLSNKVWKKIEDAKADKGAGKSYNADIIEDEPLFNPYHDQTFGLPPGTVRGMIAFSLLFGSIGLLIVSFGLKNEISPNSLFRDQFEFFKTAFLMMVAFYFGARSLKYLKGEKSVEPYNTVNAQKKGISAFSSKGTEQTESRTKNVSSSASTQTLNPPATKVVVVDSSDPKGEKNIEPGTKPAIIGIDPMAKS